MDTQVATAVPLAGGNMTGALTTPAVNGVEAPAVGERADDAAGGDERGGNERGDGDSADLCGDGYVHECERREGDGFADERARSRRSAA